MRTLGLFYDQTRLVDQIYQMLFEIGQQLPGTFLGQFCIHHKHHGRV